MLTRGFSIVNTLDKSSILSKFTLLLFFVGRLQMKDDFEYEALTAKTLPDRLKKLVSITALIGKQSEE